MCLAPDWITIAQAAHEAHSATAAAGDASFLTSAELADVDAMTAQIIPSDGTPGAREAGVAKFIDRALATFLSRMGAEFRTQLEAFRRAFAARHPNVASFSALPFDQQTEFLRTVERTPFFQTMRMLTVFGMFSTPSYGGNRNNVGWQLLGFEDRHIFQPPFGYYDRDYPGFSITGAPSA